MSQTRIDQVQAHDMPNKALELTVFSVGERGRFSCSVCYCRSGKWRWRQLSFGVVRLLRTPLCSFRVSI